MWAFALPEKGRDSFWGWRAAGGPQGDAGGGAAERQEARRGGVVGGDDRVAQRPGEHPAPLPVQPREPLGARGGEPGPQRLAPRRDRPEPGPPAQGRAAPRPPGRRAQVGAALRRAGDRLVRRAVVPGDERTRARVGQEGGDEHQQPEGEERRPLRSRRTPDEVAHRSSPRRMAWPGSPRRRERTSRSSTAVSRTTMTASMARTTGQRRMTCAGG